MSTDISPTPNSGAMGNPQFLSQGNIPHSLTHTHMHKTGSLFPHKVRGVIFIIVIIIIAIIALIMTPARDPKQLFKFIWLGNIS